MTFDFSQNWFLERKGALSTFSEAFQLSAHVLLKDYDQLTSQLVGRMLGSDDPQLNEILQRGIKKKRTPWLRLLTPTLAPPGGPLLRTLAGAEMRELPYPRSALPSTSLFLRMII